MKHPVEHSQNGTQVPHISVLIADADSTYQQHCQHVIKRPHIQVHSVDSATSALKQIEEDVYDVILMDALMPDMDGLECFAKIRQQGCHTPVIFVSENSDLRTAVEAIKRGVADFITKPFDADALVEKIERLTLVDDDELDRRRRKERRKDDRRQGDRRTSGIGDRRAGERRTDDRRRGEDRRLRKDDPVVTYIRQNATTISGRRDVAEAMGLNVDQVSSRVLVATGKSFRQLLNQCRLQKACRLLKETDMEIARIAENTGFSTVQHFSRVFSSINGLSPRKYRQKNRRENATV